MRVTIFLILKISSYAYGKHPITLQEEEAKYALSNNPNDVHFYLYPVGGNPVYEQEIVYNDRASLTSSSFNPDAAKTIILIHGFTGSRTTHMNAVLVQAYLKSNLPYNFIVVDWSPLSGSTPFNNDMQQIFIYTKVVSQSIPIVAQRTAQFIKFLGTSASKLHVIGHSLGAHVSGNAGRNYFKSTGIQIQRITGVDPAGPLFLISFPFPKLSKNDAVFVDIIHTNRGEAGDLSIDGDVDFIVNGGSQQPGCGLDPSCSHLFAPTLYAASITKQFLACPCGPIDLASGVLLGGDIVEENCGNQVPLGEACPETAEGLYCLHTSNPP